MGFKIPIVHGVHKCIQKEYHDNDSLARSNYRNRIDLSCSLSKPNVRPSISSCNLGRGQSPIGLVGRVHIDETVVLRRDRTSHQWAYVLSGRIQQQSKVKSYILPTVIVRHALILFLNWVNSPVPVCHSVNNRHSAYGSGQVLFRNPYISETQSQSHNILSQSIIRCIQLELSLGIQFIP